MSGSTVYAGGYATGTDSTSTVSVSDVKVEDSTLKGLVIGGSGDGSHSLETAAVALKGATLSDKLDLSGATSITDVRLSGINTVGTLTDGTVKKYQFEAGDQNEGENKAVLNFSSGTIDLSNAKTIIKGAHSGSHIIQGGTDNSITANKGATIELANVFGSVKIHVEEDVEGKNLYTTADGVKLDDTSIKGTATANGDAKSLTESFLGSMAFVNQGAEFIADEGLATMDNAAKTPGPATFGAIHGGSTRYQTGSHVTVDGASLAAGVASKIADVTVGGFVEAGWANADIETASANGSGDHDYYGVGLAARYRATDSFFLDGSLRVGWAKTKFSGVFSGTLYTTAHIGAGYVIPVTKTIQATPYARYIYSFLQGDDVDVKGADAQLQADDISTHAVRVGIRFTGTPNENYSWRAGLAYEHVFDGDADGHIQLPNGLAALDAPSLSGNTGIAELGATFTPSATSPWAVDAGLKGYVGDRRGVTGNATVRYRF